MEWKDGCTKGKWEVSEYGACKIIVMDAKILSVILPSFVSINEMKANAKLIAAAPDLLEACMKAMEKCVDLIGTEEGNAIEVAIKKATK